jgi:hypothetical protein
MMPHTTLGERIMTLEHMPLASALLIAALSTAAWSQVSVQPAAPGASTAAATKPAPRLVTNTEQRESSTPAGGARSEPKAVPQINIPLVNGARGPQRVPYRSRGGSPAVAGGIIDSAARCEAESDAELRAQCHAKREPAPQR